MDSCLHPLKVGLNLIDETMWDISRTLAKIEIVNFHFPLISQRIAYKKK